MGDPRPCISVVVPVHDEEASILLLTRQVRESLKDEAEWELIFVDDGSNDGTAQVVREAEADDARVRLVQLARRYGQATGMQAGFDHSSGDFVITMDGDLQNDARDIPRVLEKLRESSQAAIEAIDHVNGAICAKMLLSQRGDNKKGGD